MVRKIFYIYIFLIPIAFIFQFSGWMQEFDDVSSDEKFSHLINAEYQSIQKLLIHGITLDANYLQKVDKYTVTDFPGMGGREIVTVGRLEVGTIFRVKKVLKCNNCFLFSPISILVEINTEGLEPDIPVELYGLRIEDTDGRIILDPNFLVSMPKV